MMKNIVIIISLFFAGNVMSKTYECKSHPSSTGGRKFSAKVAVLTPNDKIEAEILDLHLSEVWPLDSECDAPKIGIKLVGAIDGNELELSLENEKECGFIFYISTDEKNAAMLSPRK